MIFPLLNNSHVERALIEDQFTPLEYFRMDTFDPVLSCMLPEHPDPSRFESILDVGCGIGWWLIKTAQAHSQIVRLIGLEANAVFVEDARIIAQAERVHDRVSFVRGDGLAPLPFPDASFDLIHLRFGESRGKVRTDEWPQVLDEYRRISVPGGVVCLTEIASVLSRSPALERLTSLLLSSLEHAGYRVPTSNSQAIHLSRILEQSGVRDVKQQEALLAFGPGDPETRDTYLVHLHLGLQALVPFLSQQTQLAEQDLTNLIRQMSEEIHHPDFEGHLTLVAVWGTLPDGPPRTPPGSIPTNERAVILARTRQAERACRYAQDRFFADKMGALVPLSYDPALVHTVLDVGSGPGGWLIEMARTYPHLTQLVGIEAHPHLVASANQQAEAAGVADRVRFQVGTAAGVDHTFDLVHQRFGMRHLREWEWGQSIPAYRRATSKEGLLCLTEASLLRSNSPTLEWLMERFLNALFAAGYLFTPDRQGLIDHLPRKMKNYFVRILHQDRAPISFGRTDEGALATLDRGFEAMEPFIRKWSPISAEAYWDCYDQMCKEIRQPGFEATITLLTVWGYGRQR